MKYYKIKNTDMTASAVVMGCMHLSELDDDAARETILSALDNGINYFDHADVYNGGDCEAVFGRAMPMDDAQREKVILQSKCGIVRENVSGPIIQFDFSRKRILEAVEGTLERLKTKYLDVLLLHRPDPLMEPEEVGEAFRELHRSGKVRHFGVSNQTPYMIELLQSKCEFPLLFNQLQFSIAHASMISSGLTMNTTYPTAVNRDCGILEYCRLKEILIQAWSPFQKGFFGGPFLGDMEEYADLNNLLNEIAQQRGTTAEALAVAWILRHPANMQVITGTTKPYRIKECAAGADIELTRDEWYRIYIAAGNFLP